MKDVETKKYYAVECKCGHTGSKKTYIPIKFAVVASSGKEAAEKGRWIPRCKHHHKDCILGVEEISKEEYLLLLNQNSKDSYLHCTSIQEQSHYDLEDRFVKESRYQDDDDFEKLILMPESFDLKLIEMSSILFRTFLIVSSLTTHSIRGILTEVLYFCEIE